MSFLSQQLCGNYSNFTDGELMLRGSHFPKAKSDNVATMNLYPDFSTIQHWLNTTWHHLILNKQ